MAKGDDFAIVPFTALEEGKITFEIRADPFYSATNQPRLAKNVAQHYVKTAFILPD